MLPSPLRRKSSKLSLSSPERMDQENVDQAHQYRRERRSSILGSVFKMTSTLRLSGQDADRDSSDTMPQPPPRSDIPKVFNFLKYACGKQRILETMDQNTTDTASGIEELNDIDDEELGDKVIPVPYVDEEEALDLLSTSSASTNHAQSSAIVDSELRKDSRLVLEMQSGPYYEVWDPRASDHLSIMGRVTYQPHSPSQTTPQLAHLIYLSVDAFMRCPRKPIKGETEVKYLKLVENSTVLEPKKPESTIAEERHPDKKTIEAKLAQPEQRPALSPILGFLSPGSTLDLQVKPIVWFRGTQVCMFMLTLPVADPFLFPDNGAGDVVRTIKVRVRGVIRVLDAASGRISVNESIVEENIVVNVLKKTALMDR